MVEQKHMQKTTNRYETPEQPVIPSTNDSPVTIHPAEGRCDVAEDLEEEQRNAYSTHHATISSQREEVTLKTQQSQNQQREERTQNTYIPSTNDSPATIPPAEGRCDIAEDVEEEQRNAYSAHHATTSS